MCKPLVLRFWCSGSSDKGLAVLLRFPTLEPYIRHLKDTPQRADDFVNGTDISTNKKEIRSIDSIHSFDLLIRFIDRFIDSDH